MMELSTTIKVEKMDLISFLHEDEAGISDLFSRSQILIAKKMKITIRMELRYLQLSRTAMLRDCWTFEKSNVERKKKSPVDNSTTKGNCTSDDEYRSIFSYKSFTGLVSFYLLGRSASSIAIFEDLEVLSIESYWWVTSLSVEGRVLILETTFQSMRRREVARNMNAYWTKRTLGSEVNGSWDRLNYCWSDWCLDANLWEMISIEIIYDC